MFTKPFTSEDEDIFSKLLGVPLLSCDILKVDTNREVYFASARSCHDHLFLDPYTGLRLKTDRVKNHPAYLFGSEIISIVSERPTLLTLVFDQSLARGQERHQLEEKMVFLEERGVYSFAYVSHACFILMSAKQELVMKAWEVIRSTSGLPAARFIVNTKSHNYA